MASTTGYGPRHRLLFDGDEEKYELWEIKFLGHMRLQKLHKIILPSEDEVDEEKNAEAFAELVQCLDDRSLSLVIRDAKDNGRRALEILREHYLSKGKSRIISLYTELTSLKKANDESVTDYMIRAETAATSLKTSGEVISDSLLIAMVLKGLPSEFKSFSTVITQKDKVLKFSEFKLKSSDTRKHGGFSVACYTCGKHGHRAADCRVNDQKSKKRWCDICKKSNHDTKWCRRKDSVKTLDNSQNDVEGEHNFLFKVSFDTDQLDRVHEAKGLLVDCGATTHIINDESKFVRFEDNFNPSDHYIELADGSRNNNVAIKRGDAQISLVDSTGKTQTGILENALYVPSFKQNIFSVQAATEKGASVQFKPNAAELVSPEGTKFNIERNGRLYYLNNTISNKIASHTLKEWHEILGHCNVKDVLKLKDVVEGMNITGKHELDCGICIEGKMTQYRNREPDKRACSILELVHCDLAGPIEPIARDDFRYAMSFVDDYSGLIMVYFLREKSDTLRATEKFLADIAPHGSVKCIRSDQGGEFVSKAFESLLVKNHIKHEKSAPYSPHQNGTAERAWRSLFEMARCLLLQSSCQRHCGLMLLCFQHMFVTDVTTQDFRKPHLSYLPAKNPTLVVGYVPKTYQEAITCPASSDWQKAMKDEMSALRENDTFELNPLPEGRKVVGGRWVYAVKLGPNDEEQYKARYVAKGFSQLPNVDYNETFSPTARISSIRALMQLSIQHNLIVHQMDVKTAYLNAPIDCELYVEQPEGFAVSGKNGEKLVCRLKKSLYGLKQSGRNWNSLLHSYFVGESYSQSLVDPCVYTKHEENDMTIILVWVDDIIITTNRDSILEDVKRGLTSRFKMKDLGEISMFLGMRFICEVDMIKINQSKYIEKMLLKYGMKDCKARSTPCEMNVDKVFENPEDQIELTDARLYREIVGSLIYVMTSTRPDLCYTVTKLAQHMSNPTMAHLTMAKHALRYLKGTIYQSLIYRKSVEPLSLIGFCDSSWGNSEDRRSITGYCFQLSENGPLISWKSTKQRTVALSTCEAEYMALAAATQEAKFLVQLWRSMTNSDSVNTVSLYCDNQGALALAKNPVHHQRSKHIDIRYHFIRLEVQKGNLQLVYVPSEQNVADIFTKPVSGSKLQKFGSQIMGI
ncbi:hypothetical protein BSL78_23335 [Apostichopus japonicus]|uniref:Retrovirus-related Pol polyprotein from transposon TNT 1-94 n=1 Tax=Stichopus japonicus TaxID=307972 RepID=A0A2G8JVM6_STIJA|nr:hypothetical protein BSL78_23335 [Apostichopus japonicus]